MSTILFKDLLLSYSQEIKTYMRWENYDLNDVTIPVMETLKDHALVVLMNSYGSFHVEQDIIDSLCADVFIYFPILMQQLAISRLMDAYGVVKDDINTEELIRTETTNTEVDQSSELTLGSSSNENNVLDTEQKTTGTVKVENDMTNTQNSKTNIENNSGVESTGSRSVNLSHNMPEQSLNSTGNFPKDQQGTPILESSFVQNASENFNSSNPINTSETSEQIINNTTTGNNDALTTNDVTVSDSGTTSRTITNSGSDNSQLNSSTDGTTDITEKRTRTETNKQYAYEIKAFLESTDTLVAFSRWEDKFSWVVGII